MENKVSTMQSRKALCEILKKNKTQIEKKFLNTNDESLV